MKLVSVAEMREIESEANAQGFTYERMMMKAGQGLADLINRRFRLQTDMTILGLVGNGNNGGDTLVALTELQTRGWKTTALLMKERKDEPLLQDLSAAGGMVILASELKTLNQLKKVIDASVIILDGIMGTGFKFPLREEINTWLTEIKRVIQKQIVIAVDCPSAVDCDSGEISPVTLKANLTVCMEAIKGGLVKFPAFEYCGELAVVPLGLPRLKSLSSIKHFVTDADLVKELIPVRPIDGYKGTFGTVMVVGGSVTYTGAPLLAGMAAYRSGCGLVTLAVPQAVRSCIAGASPEITWLVLNDEDGVISELAADLLSQKLEKVNCLVVGPGIGREETTGRFLDRFLLQQEKNGKSRRVGFLPENEAEKLGIRTIPAVVLDADALHWLASVNDWPTKITCKLVMTPHIGEMSAISGLSIEEIQKDRIGCAMRFAEKWQQVLVLKGALTVVAAPNGWLAVIPVASSALAKAGSGDVLSGIIASLIGQGMGLFEAAVAGAWLHGQAGLAAAQRIGCDASVLARDIIESIPVSVQALNKNTAR